MGFSIAIIAFAIEDADVVLERMQWAETDQEVGVPVDPAKVSIEDLLDQDRQQANNPHFSSARGETHFFVYLSRSELGPHVTPDLSAMSLAAPLTAYFVVETNRAATVERWEEREKVWAVGGAANIEYEIIGDAPVDLVALAQAYREWWASLPHDEEFLEPGELDLPENDSDLILQNFNSLIDDWFSAETGFRYAGDHLPLYRLSGELPVLDRRRTPRE